MAFNVYKQYETSKETEQRGIRVEFGKNVYGEDVFVILARAGGSNDRFEKAVETRTKPYLRQIQKGTFPKEKSIEMMAEIYADTIVLDWGGMVDRDDNRLDFNRANVIKILIDNPEFFNELSDIARDAAGYRQSLLDDAVKN